MPTAKIIRIHELGGPEVLRVEELPLQDPKAGEVRIRVQAIGLNRAEVMFRTGQYVEQPVAVATGQSIGDFGTYGESAIIPAASAIPYPDNLSPEQAASVWVQYLTAYFAFVDVAHVQPGQHILMTAATGGAGLGAIEMARLLGANTIATTRSAAKKQALLDAGAHHVIVIGREDLVSRVKEITGGKGADVIFDPVAGDSLPALAEAVTWGGQIILYGALGGVNTPYPLFAGFARNFTLRTYMVYNFCGLPTIGLPRNEDAFTRAVKFINENLAFDKLRPVIAKVFPLSQIQEAHRYLESNQQFGKVVVAA